MAEPRYIYGYGSTKHISDPDAPPCQMTWRGGPGLCGAYGGYPVDQPERPECKRCRRKYDTKPAS